MSPSLFSLLDMGIAGVAVVGVAVWQLVSVSREIRHDKRDSPEGESPRGSGHPVGEHRLDDG